MLRADSGQNIYFDLVAQQDSENVACIRIFFNVQNQALCEAFFGFVSIFFECSAITDKPFCYHLFFVVAHFHLLH